MQIYQAIHTALTAHGNQKRKLDYDQYVAHPLEVGVILAQFQQPDAVICAGILHDTLEDTTLTYDMLKQDFGTDIADLVNAVTEQDKSLSWHERKTHYINQINTYQSHPLFKSILLIVCADKLTNLTNIASHKTILGEGLWDKFNAGQAEQQWYYEHILVCLEPISDHALYRRLKAVIKEVFDL
jgi:(p)ppGpp synthase/HD superfamily hydrolase